jgi:16S rRNA (guanine527-N7)-methyltransferase
VPPGDEPASATLAEALERQGLQLPAGQAAQLDRYCRLLWDWNRKLNLTRHTDYDRFVGRDVVDALAFCAALAQGEDVLDVGTGGGVPGVLVAILRPDVSVSLAESVAKKARAVQQMVAELGLHVPVHHARAEELLEDEIYDTLLVRAVAPLPKLLTWFAPRWHAFRRLLVIKGPSWPDERKAARERRLLAGLQLRVLSRWALPGSGAESVLLEIRPKEPASRR